ncbi:MAG: sugar transferase [Pseudomonadota bacterium]
MGRLHLLIDCVLVGIAAVIAFSLRDQSVFAALERPGLGLYAVASIGFGLVIFSATRVSRGVWRFFSFVDIFRVVGAAGIAILLAWSTTFLIDRSELIPRSVPVLHWICAAFLMCAARATVRLSLRPSFGRRDVIPVSALQHVLVVGSDELAELYIRCAKRLSQGRVAVVGLLAEDGAVAGRSVSGVPVLGSPTDIANLVNTQAIHGVFIDSIVVAQPFESLSRSARTALRDYEKHSGRALDFFEDRLGFPKVGDQMAAQTAAVAPRQYQTSGSYHLVKRALDAVAAFALLVLFAPLIAITWLAALIDVGAPAFFWQLRPGLHGKPLRVLKVRTMRGAHDERGARIPDQNRSSAIGEALRRYRLDELPQLINILKGDMSFIGPRPLLPVDQPKDASIRLSVRPGLTGWAQVNGGRILTPEDKAALDAWYVENMSFALDVRIAVMTLQVLLWGEKDPQDQVLRSAHGAVARQRLNLPS